MYKGVALSVLASVTFGVLYFYTFFLKPLDSEQTFAWRMLSTLPFLSAFMWWSGDLKLISELFKRIFKQPWMFAWLLFSSVLCTTQLWLFFSALRHGVGWLHPLQGKTIQLSNVRGSPCSSRGGT